MPHSSAPEDSFRPVEVLTIPRVRPAFRYHNRIRPALRYERSEEPIQVLVDQDCLSPAEIQALDDLYQEQDLAYHPPSTIPLEEIPSPYDFRAQQHHQRVLGPIQEVSRTSISQNMYARGTNAWNQYVSNQYSMEIATIAEQRQAQRQGASAKGVPVLDFEEAVKDHHIKPRDAGDYKVSVWLTDSDISAIAVQRGMPEWPTEFPGEYRSFSNMLAANEFLKSVIEYFLSFALHKCGGRLIPIWTTSGVRYQYIPKDFAPDVDIVEVFETLLDIRSELTHQVNQLYLSKNDNFEGYNVTLWRRTGAGLDLNWNVSRDDLSKSISEVLWNLSQIVGIQRDGASWRQSMLTINFMEIRYLIAQFDFLLPMKSSDTHVHMDDLEGGDEQGHDSTVGASIDSPSDDQLRMRTHFSHDTVCERGASNSNHGHRRSRAGKTGE